ncbi:unnamed protein product [Microthlaspi erraticum]|uniref:Uncharacterized protein n=1 Tax=Microthlaspi erraticum TaxID=1685480 RepID=A0A6D2KMD1_9BRAS|nr:unnamed protein product [Microthlaspi erraticum]
MDFIKTSSLRALIELTFQRNWNGLIWMSRKGVITKRVRLSRRLYRENSAQPRSPAGRETIVSRSAKVTSVRLKSRPKFETDRPITQHDPGNIVPRSAKSTFHATPRTTMPREPGNKASRPRNPRVPRPMHPSEPGKNVPRPAEKPHRPNLNPLDHAARPMMIDRRPTVPTPRSTRSPF